MARRLRRALLVITACLALTSAVPATASAYTVSLARTAPYEGWRIKGEGACNVAWASPAWRMVDGAWVRASVWSYQQYYARPYATGWYQVWDTRYSYWLVVEAKYLYWTNDLCVDGSFGGRRFSG